MILFPCYCEIEPKYFILIINKLIIIQTDFTDATFQVQISSLQVHFFIKDCFGFCFICKYDVLILKVLSLVVEFLCEPYPSLPPHLFSSPLLLPSVCHALLRQDVVAFISGLNHRLHIHCRLVKNKKLKNSGTLCFFHYPNIVKA